MPQTQKIQLSMWTDDMGEISGFGGEYEEACRRMVCAGVDWFLINGHQCVPNPVGGFLFAADEKTAKVNHDAFRAAVDAAEPSCSGAMSGAAASHAAGIFWRGWEDYAREMRARKNWGRP